MMKPALRFATQARLLAFRAHLTSRAAFVQWRASRSSPKDVASKLCQQLQDTLDQHPAILEYVSSGAAEASSQPKTELTRFMQCYKVVSELDTFTFGRERVAFPGPYTRAQWNLVIRVVRRSVDSDGARNVCWDILKKRVQEDAGILDPFHLSRLASFAAKLRMQDSALFKELMSRSASVAFDFDTTRISRILVACATVRYSDADFCDSMRNSLMSKAFTLKASDVPWLAHAFARMRRADAGLYDTLANVATLQMVTTKPREIAMLALALAKVEFRSEAVLGTIARSATAKANEFDADDIAQMIHAACRTMVVDVPLFTTMALRARTKMSANSASNSSIASLLHTFAVALSRAQLQHKIAIAAIQGVQTQCPREVADVNEVLETTELLDVVARAALRRITMLKNDQLGRVAWSLVRIGKGSDIFSDRLIAAILEKIHSFREYACRMLIWSVAHVELPDHCSLDRLQDAILRHVLANGWARLRSKSGPLLSGRERQVLSIVDWLVLGSSGNRYLLGLGFELDIAIEGRQGGILNVEIDGPTHDSREQRRIDARRDNMFEQVGIRVVRVKLQDQRSHDRDLVQKLVHALRGSGAMFRL